MDADNGLNRINSFGNGFLNNGFGGDIQKNGLRNFNSASLNNVFRSSGPITSQNSFLNSQLNDIRTRINTDRVGNFPTVSVTPFVNENIKNVARPSNNFDILSMAKNLQNNNAKSILIKI